MAQIKMILTALAATFCVLAYAYGKGRSLGRRANQRARQRQKQKIGCIKAHSIQPILFNEPYGLMPFQVL